MFTWGRAFLGARMNQQVIANQPISLVQWERVRIDNLGLNSLPINVSGDLQYVFRVRNTSRGVAAVGRGSLNPLIARCLVGLELIAALAQFVGPFFAVAFNGRWWCTLERPAGNVGGGAQIRIQRREGDISSVNRQQQDEFIVNLREALRPSLEFEYV